MKKQNIKVGIGVLAFGVLLMGGCHKSCTCVKNNGTTHTFSAEEVKAHGGNCNNMVYIYSQQEYIVGQSTYSVCNWD